MYGYARSLFVISLILFGLDSSAKVKQFTYENKKYEIEVPEGWFFTQGVMNDPVRLMSPKDKETGTSTVLSWHPVELKDEKDVFEKSKKDETTYFSQKENFIQSVGGDSLHYYPLTESEKNGSKFLTFGADFEINTDQLHEMNFFVKDSKKNLHFFQLMTDMENEAHKEVAKRVVENFKGSQE